MARASSAAVANFSLVRNMVRKTPSVKAATEADTSPATAWPAAKGIAAWTVELTSTAGTAAEAVFSDRSVARATADRARPRRASRDRNRSRLHQPGQDGPFRTAQTLGRLLVSVALQVTEDEGGPILLRQATDLLIEDRPQVAPEHLIGSFPCRHVVQRRFAGAAGLLPGPQAESNPVSHLVEPAADRVAFADGRGLASKHQEGDLEGILGLMVVVQDALAEAEDHRAMPPDQHLEGGLVALADELLQQLGVRQRATALPADEPTQLVADRVRWFVRHGVPIPEWASLSR